MLFLDYIQTLFSQQKAKFQQENKLKDIYDVNLLIQTAYRDDRFQRFCDGNRDLIKRNEFLLVLARKIKQEQEEEKQIAEEAEQNSQALGTIKIA